MGRNTFQPPLYLQEAAGFNPDNAAALGIDVTLDNDGEGNYTVTATNVPVGAHALRVRASDGCY